MKPMTRVISYTDGNGSWSIHGAGWYLYVFDLYSRRLEYNL